MRIAMVFDGLGLGGIEKVGIDYVQILNQLGYQVDIYNLDPEKNELENKLPSNCTVIHYKLPSILCPELYRYGVKKWWWGKYVYPLIHFLLSINLFFRKFFYRKTTPQYDIVVAFSGHMNDLTFVANNFLESKAKLCWLHGSLIDYMVINSGFGTLYKKIKNLNVLSNYGEEVVLNGSKFLKDLNINKIYNPTFIEEKKISTEIAEELTNLYGDYLLMVGRFTEQKDQTTVIKAMYILKDKYKIRNKIVFVGDGDKRKEAEKLVIKLNLQDSVIFVGSRWDVENFYSTAKIFVHSSPLEGLPTVLLEAMNYGLPIVATESIPGVPEILQKGEYGLICPVNNEDKMAELIYQLLTDKELYKYYSEKGKERIAVFKPDIIQNELKKILNSLIEKS